MKPCGYCGRMNEDQALCCTECGTRFEPVEEARTKPVKDPAAPCRGKTRVLDARSATTILLAYVAAQALCGVLLGAVAGVLLEVLGMQSLQQGLLLDKLIPGLTILAIVLSGIIMLRLSFILVPHQLRDTGPQGGAFVRGPLPAILRAFLIGLIIAAFAHLVARATKSHIAPRHLSHLNRMAFMPGLPRLVWVVAGVVLAPSIEEFLFRGVLYGGYRKSFGPGWAAVTTTLLFVAMHLPEAAHHFPTIAKLIVVASAALWCRLRWSAIGPAVAVHAGSNVMGALIFLVSRMV